MLINHLKIRRRESVKIKEKNTKTMAVDHDKISTKKWLNYIIKIKKLRKKTLDKERNDPGISKPGQHSCYRLFSMESDKKNQKSSTLISTHMGIK